MEIRIIFILLLLSFNSFSQKADLSVFIGSEATKLEEFFSDADDAFAFSNHDFDKRSYFVGLEIKQPIYKKFGLSIRSSFGRKYVKGHYASGFFGYKNLDYLHTYNSLLIKQGIFNWFAIKGGIGHNFLFRIKTNGSLIREYNYFGTINDEWVGITGASLAYKKLNLEILYAFGLEDHFVLFYSKPTRSFRIILGYKFKTLKWNFPKGRKKAKCPKL